MCKDTKKRDWEEQDKNRSKILLEQYVLKFHFLKSEKFICWRWHSFQALYIPVLTGGWYLRIAEAVEALMSSCTQSGRPHQPYWQLQWVGQILPGVCADLCDQKCSSKPDQRSNHRYVGLHPGSAIPSLLRVRTVLGSIGEEIALGICLSGWAKHAVSQVCLGSMSPGACVLNIDPTCE